MKFIKNHKYKILIFLIIISLVSFLETLSKGFLNGCDFQWQPSVLFWDGINHYEKFIKNSKSDFLCQGGEYGHLLHVILYLIQGQQLSFLHPNLSQLLYNL